MPARIKYPHLHDRCALRRLIAKYGSCEAIARKLGCHPRVVCRARKALGMARRGGRPVQYPALRDPTALNQLLTECGTYAAVARKLGCHRQTVYKAVAKLRMEERKE